MRAMSESVLFKQVTGLTILENLPYFCFLELQVLTESISTVYFQS